MFSMMFALAIITIMTLGTTIGAMLLVDWVLVRGQGAISQGTPSDDRFLAQETRAFSGRLASL
jgi:hypothetical protein